ncbi:MAG: putative ribosomal-protein-amino-adic N-acetyltransferase [Flavipsychrobacter sp.]|jgi:RimJ/RimL family protein N-acetyltransferase|nr:putative ribosomal-protein-amino-adic N-acetyltransferase [Flavipsychrobacter sp.]
MNYLLYGQETARLTFKPVELSYAETWLNLFKKEGVARFVGLDHLGTPEEQRDQWFERAFLRISNGLGGLNALVNKQTGELVGQSGLLVQTVDEQTHLEVGYSILPKYWRQGYAIEAASKCRDCAFEKGLTDTLISIIHVENEPSMAVARANGMKLWKTTNYKGSPVHIFRINRQEWSAKNIKCAS